MPLKELKTELTKRFGRVERTLQRRAKRIKQDHGPMSWQLAWAVLAQDAGVDAADYLDHPPDAADVRNIRHDRALLDSPEARKRVVSPARTILVRIGTDFQLQDPLLPPRVLSDAKAMTRVYAKLYVFENSVREVIKRVLCKKYGSAWWNQCISGKIQAKATVRMKDDERNAWHGRRGTHPIHYVDMPDLGRIIAARWKHDFRGLFHSLEWISVRLDEISRSRNTVDHHNPLRPKDRKLIELYFVHWFDQIESVKDQLPDCGTLPPPATGLPG